MTHGSDGLFGKIFKKSISDTWKWWTFLKIFIKSISDTWKWWTFWRNVYEVHQWHMEVMDFLEKCLKSPSLTHGSDGLFGKKFMKPITDTWEWWTFVKMFKKSITDAWEWWTFWENLQKVHHWHIEVKKSITDTWKWWTLWKNV